MFHVHCKVNFPNLKIMFILFSVIYNLLVLFLLLLAAVGDDDVDDVGERSRRNDNEKKGVGAAGEEVQS